MRKFRRKMHAQWRELTQLPAQMQEVLNVLKAVPLREFSQLPAQMQQVLDLLGRVSPEILAQQTQRILDLLEALDRQPPAAAGGGAEGKPVAANFPHMTVEAGIKNGRVPLEGYQRGWSLQHGSLLEIVESERLFKEACEPAAKLSSWIGRENRANLYLLLTRFLPALAERNVIEFGSFKGGTAVFFAIVLREVAPEAKVYALDTFKGMPATDKSIDWHEAGDFDDASFSLLRNAIATLGLENIIPVKGLFQETFPTLAPGTKFGLAHIDADIYSAIKYAQDAVWPRMTKGGYVVYDDANVSSCLGATQAVEELIQERRLHSEQVWPHFVFRANLADGT